MSDKLSTETLAQALAQTLEEAAFVFAELPDADPALPDELMEARLAYVGPLGEQGELTLATGTDLAATLAANLLGEDEGGAALVGDDQDAVGELLNMIAGHLVVTLFGEDATCRLGLPRVRRVGPEEHARTLAGATAFATLVEEEGRRIDLAGTVGARA